MTVEEELQRGMQEPSPEPFHFNTPVGKRLVEYVGERRRHRLGQETDLPPYAAPIDDDVRRVLGRIPFGGRIDDYLEKVIQYQMGPTIHNAVRVSPRQFPGVYRVVDRCANRLGIPVPRVLVTPDLRIHSATVGTEENHFILLTSALVEKCSEMELTFLVGHECGHIHCRHLTYLALARTLFEVTSNMAMLASSQLIQPLKMMLQVPLAAWQRKAELTCDRAGLICSHELEPSLRALAKQVTQATGLADQIDLNEYLRDLDQTDEEESAISKLPEFLASVPFVPKRMRALQIFAHSQVYFEMTHQSAPEGALSREELEKQTDRVTRIL